MQQLEPKDLLIVVRILVIGTQTANNPADMVDGAVEAVRRYQAALPEPPLLLPPSPPKMLDSLLTPSRMSWIPLVAVAIDPRMDTFLSLVGADGLGAADTRPPRSARAPSL